MVCGREVRLDSGGSGRVVGGGWWVLWAVPWPVSPALPSVQPGWSQHPVSELVGETGGAAHAQSRGGSQGTGELAPPVGQQRSGGWGGHLLAGVELAGGDGGLPGHPSGDHDPQPPQQGRGQRGAGLGGGELVVVAAGEVDVAGAEDGVGVQRTPGGPPGRQPQGGSASPGDAGGAGVGAGLVVAGAQAGVLDQRAGGVEAGWSPVSARMAAAPTALSPGMLATRLVSWSWSRMPVMRCSVSASWPRAWCQSPSTSAARSNPPGRWASTPSVSLLGSVAAVQTARMIRWQRRTPPQRASWEVTRRAKRG
jgi:hypothetical protein